MWETTPPRKNVESDGLDIYPHLILQLLPLPNPDKHMFLQEDSYQAEPVTQLSLKSGLKQCWNKAYEAEKSEMRRQHFCDTFKPLHWNSPTRAELLMVLEFHMFLKEKRDGKLKGRTVAGGSKQRDKIKMLLHSLRQQQQLKSLNEKCVWHYE
jgi:hypothetical protein